MLMLTRGGSGERMRRVTVAPITSTARGIAAEVPLTPRNGIDHPCAVSIDNVLTIDRSQLGRQVGYLFDDQEPALAAAIAYAFDLDIPHVI